MNADQISRLPPLLKRIEDDTEALGFGMASDRKTGALLRALAASKPGGKLLELGTGTGLSACWLLAGMDGRARLTTVDNDESALAVAGEHLGHDARIAIHCMDGAEFLASRPDERFDLIFADAWPGKFSQLDEALALLAPGGLYVIDDLLPQANWPEGHAPKVPRLIEALDAKDDLVITKLAWSTGILIATRKP